jgi:hypothetical protein
MRASPQRLNRIFKHTFAALALPAIVGMFAANTALAAPPLPGAIFTTDAGCGGVNINIFASKAAVFLDGGPAHVGAAGLPAGSYCVQVTDPSGATVLGKSLPGAVTVGANGEFVTCYQLSTIVNSASSGFTAAGYDDSPNNGDEYKVWVSTDCSFVNDSTKTDNFKVKSNGGGGREPQGLLSVIKYYDANVSGSFDPGEQLITGWKIRMVDGIDYIRYTPVSIILDPETYTVSEFNTVEANWIHTTPNSVSAVVQDSDVLVTSVEFGNVCLGAGGGLTLGFWSNKNGERAINDGNSATSELTLLSALCLRDASGNDFDPTTYTQFRTWLLNATAVNMAYMLSAQLAAMELNVEAGYVSNASVVYAPGCGNTGVGNSYISIGDLRTAAAAALCADGYTPSGDVNRTLQECLKNALDNANNNRNFVQSGPCAFSFAP